MAKKLGSNYRLFVQSVTPGTFNQPLGQGNLTRSDSPTFFPTSTKETGVYGTQAPGKRATTLSQQLIPDLPDANGYTRMETLGKTQATEVYQIRKAPFDDEDDVVFEALCYTTIDTTAYDMDAAVGVSVTLTLAEAPTIDTLA